MHIGLIGGIGPAATEFYYRGLARAFAAAGRVMELTIVHADINQLVKNLTAGDPQRQAEAFLPLVQRLQAAGADVAAVTSMGGHFCIEELAAISPLPLNNLIPEMAAELTRRKLRRIGLLGTRSVMQNHIYGAIPSIEVVLPQGDNLDATHTAYVAMAQAGQVTDHQRELFFALGDNLVSQHGAEAIALVGTDLCLAFDGRDPGFPVIDGAQVHVNALYRAATANG